MGERINASNEQSSRQIHQSTTGTGANNSSSSSPTPSSGRNTGTVETSGTGGTSGNEKEKGFPQLVTIEETEEQKRLAKNEKRRQRYAQKKAENGGEVKPRKVNKAKEKTVNESFTQEQMSMLLMTLSTVLASRPNCEHWQLTQAEVDSITKPLLNILKESEKLEAITQNSNQIALAIACITIFVPRLVVTVQKVNENKEKKELAKEVQKIDEVRPTKANDKGASRPSDKQLTNYGTKPRSMLQEIGLPTY